MGNKARRLQRIAEKNASVSAEREQPDQPEYDEEITYEFDNSAVQNDNGIVLDDEFIDSGSGPPSYIELTGTNAPLTPDEDIKINYNGIATEADLIDSGTVQSASDLYRGEIKPSRDTFNSEIDSISENIDSVVTKVEETSVPTTPNDDNFLSSQVIVEDNVSGIALNEPVSISPKIFKDDLESDNNYSRITNLPKSQQISSSSQRVAVNEALDPDQTGESERRNNVRIIESSIIDRTRPKSTNTNESTQNSEKIQDGFDSIEANGTNEDYEESLSEKDVSDEKITEKNQLAINLAELERLKIPAELLDDDEDEQYSREFIVEEQKIVSEKDLIDGETILQEYGPSLFPHQLTTEDDIPVNSNNKNSNENDSLMGNSFSKNVTIDNLQDDINETFKNEGIILDNVEEININISNNVASNEEKNYEEASNNTKDNFQETKIVDSSKYAEVSNTQLPLVNNEILGPDGNDESKNNTDQFYDNINMPVNPYNSDQTNKDYIVSTGDDLNPADLHNKNLNQGNMGISSDNKELEKTIVDNINQDITVEVNNTLNENELSRAESLGPNRDNIRSNGINNAQVSERDKNDGESLEGERWEGWLSEGNMGLAQTPPEGRFSTQNSGPVKFEAPRVPVIFVLGGPGSGKVTHCDNLMTEMKGITHINMTDLLQQYTISENKDFSQLSSKTVTEVLMLEMKMSPKAKSFLISGYPRSMRDVVEYSNKIQIVNGVVLVAWRQKVLERQIEYGAKLGHVVLSMAKIELQNFFKNVMPVADYFDQRGMLIAVNGERNPGEVYIDFRTAVQRILGSRDSGEGGKEIVALNGAANGTAKPVTVASVYKPPPNNFPLVIWVIGGPGSNKYTLCHKVSRRISGWLHLSVGRLLRAAAEVKDPMQAAEAGLIKAHVAAGNLVPLDVIQQLIETQMNSNSQVQGILIDSFPRNIDQVKQFEEKYNQEPVLILLDCSKLQLGRGRMDDSISSFRRRLEIFREQTLPMLKMLDEQNRLQIVEGDTDSQEVREQFMKTVLEEVERLRRAHGITEIEQGPLQDLENMLQDLEQQDEDIIEVGRNVGAYNPHIPGITTRGTTKQLNEYPIEPIRNAF